MTEFKNRWRGVSTERVYMLMEIFEEHNAQMKALIGHEFSPLTLERYTTSKKHTQEFYEVEVQRGWYGYSETELPIHDELWILVEVGAKLWSQYFDEVLIQLQEDREHLY